MQKFVSLIIQRSASGNADSNDWESLLPHHVPDWLKSPDVVAQLKDGQMAQNSAVDGNWYRGIVIEPDLDSTKVWLDGFLSEHRETLLSDDVALGIKKWKLLLLQDLDTLWAHRIISRAIVSPAIPAEFQNALDAKGQMLVRASRSEPEAFKALEELVQVCRERNLPVPDPLAAWHSLVINDGLRRVRQYGVSKYKNWGRDLFIAWAIYQLELAGISPTRNDDSKRIPPTVSGCDLVAAAFTKTLHRSLTYKNTAKIWQRYSRLPPPLSDVK